MTGLEKIIEDIRQQSNDAVSKILGEARDQAETIRKGAEAKAETIRRQYQKETEKEILDSKARAESAAQLQRRQKLLAAKQEIIGGVLQKALQNLETIPPKQYFSAVVRIAAHTAHQEKGLICFNRRDLGRLPPDFTEKLNGSLPEGSSLSISTEAAAIDSGFLLQYGGIEENCSFGEILAARRDELHDKVRAILFP